MHVRSFVWAAAMLAAVTAAHAQTAPAAPASPGAPEAAPAPADAAPVVAPKRKPKPKGPPSAVTVVNASATLATLVTVTAGDKTATLAKPLPPKARASLKLPKIKGCTVSVAATFEGAGEVQAGEFNVCKDKTIRFTD